MSPRRHRSRLVNTSSSNNFVTSLWSLSPTTKSANTALWLGLTSGLLSITPSTALTQPVSPSTAEVTTLQAIKVQGSSDAEQMLYAGGQVAPKGRVGLLGNKDFMDTPFSTINYTEQFIRDQQAQDISEVIAKTDPTVFSSGIPGESNESYSIRGLASNVGDITINGLAGMAAYYRNSPEMFERVEVLKGPSALLNGMPPKGSAGGTINLVSKRATKEPLARFSTTYHSRYQLGGHLDVGRRFGDNQQLGIRFNGAYRDGETAIKKQDKKIGLAALAVDWHSEQVRLSADLYQSKDRATGLTRGLSLAPGVSLPATPNADISWNPPWAFYDSTDKGAIVRGELALSDTFTAYATAGLSKTEFDSNMGAGQIINPAGDFKINFSGVSDDMRRKSAEVGVTGQIDTGPIAHQFAINSTYYQEDYHLRGFRNLLNQDWITSIYNPVWGPEPALPNHITPISHTKTRLTSVGVADTLSFAQDQVQLTVGVRHQQVMNESFNGTTGVRIGSRYKESAITPAVALVVKATDNLSVYTNYIEGLSQGAIAPNTAENAGEVFAPYKTKQKEIGLKIDLGEFSHTLSMYEIKRPSSYIDPFNNVFSFGGEQRNRGVEWGFFGSPIEGFRLMGGIAYSDPKVTQAANPAHQGKQATGLPKWQAKLGAEWDVAAVQGFTLTTNATSASKQYLSADNALAVPGRTVFDVGARYHTQLAGRDITLRAVVNNITNKTYWAKPHFTSLALGAPRSLQLSASVEF